MSDAKTKRSARLRRHARVRKKVSGSPERPRLAVFRSNRHIYAQLIDDVHATTIAQASDAEEAGEEGPSGYDPVRHQAVCRNRDAAVPERCDN